MFPLKNRKYRGRLTENLRLYIQFLGLGHFVFLMIEIFVYSGLQIGCILNEVFCMWLCYHNYMDLNICILYTYMITMFFAPFMGLLHILSFDIGLGLFLYIIQLGFYWYCGGYQMYVRVSIWHKAQQEKAKNETAKDKLAFLMDNKSHNAEALFSALDGKRGYQKRRDEQKMRKAHGSSMPLVHAPKNEHDLRNIARPSEHINQNHGNNIINNGIYIDTNRVRDRVEDQIVHSVLAHEKAHGHIEKRVQHEVAHRVEERMRHELEHKMQHHGGQFEQQVNNLFGEGPVSPSRHHHG